MTRSKLEFATILASLRGANEDPKQLAEDMTLRKLCYEIEKLEQEQEVAAVQVVAPDPPPPGPKEPIDKKSKVRPFWSFLQGDSDEEDS